MLETPGMPHTSTFGCETLTREAPECTPEGKKWQDQDLAVRLGSGRDSGSYKGGQLGKGAEADPGGSLGCEGERSQEFPVVPIPRITCGQCQPQLLLRGHGPGTRLSMCSALSSAVSPNQSLGFLKGR